MTYNKTNNYLYYNDAMNQIQQITFNPVLENDLAAVHLMLLSQDKSIMVRTMGFVPTMEDIQRQTIHDPDFEPQLFIGAYTDNKLVGGIIAIRRPWKDSQKETGFIKYIYVQKEFRGHGIGRILLEKCEKELKKCGVKTLLFGGSSPRYLFPGVPKTSTDLCQLLTHCGWHKQSERVSLFTEFDNISVSNQILEDALFHNSSLHIALAVSNDVNKITHFIEREFSSSWALEVSGAVSSSNKAFCSVLRMKDSGEVIGFAAVNGTNPNWFGPMGVRSDLRRQKLGHMLVYHSFLTAQKRGMSHLMIPWINGKEAFYSKFVTIPQWQVYYKFEKQL